MCFVSLVFLFVFLRVFYGFLKGISVFFCFFDEAHLGRKGAEFVFSKVFFVSFRFF